MLRYISKYIRMHNGNIHIISQKILQFVNWQKLGSHNTMYYIQIGVKL